MSQESKKHPQEKNLRAKHTSHPALRGTVWLWEEWWSITRGTTKGPRDRRVQDKAGTSVGALDAQTMGYKCPGNS